MSKVKNDDSDCSSLVMSIAISSFLAHSFSVPGGDQETSALSNDCWLCSIDLFPHYFSSLFLNPGAAGLMSQTEWLSNTP